MKLLLLLLALAVYLNIGWAFGTYFSTYIFPETPPQTFWQVVWSGGYGFWNSSSPPREPLLLNQILASLFWPFYVGSVVVSWLIFGLHQLLWLIFWGGIAKLFGVG